MLMIHSAIRHPLSGTGAHFSGVNGELMGEWAMPLDSQQKLDYLYQEYTRLANRAIEHYKSTYDDVKLFGAIGASVILWKPVYDFISSSQTTFESNLVLLVGFLGIEVLLGFISSFNRNRPRNLKEILGNREVEFL